MKTERTKNATNNIIFGTILKLYQIIVPFLMRTAMIYFLGVEYLGLNGLFTSILQVLNLAELGVGSAMTFSMYKPIIENDTDEICALMNLYKRYYRIIGSIILIIGLLICPFIPNLIKSDLPSDINIYILYLLNLTATVLSYWLFAYKSSLLEAHQRNDVISKITLSCNTIQYILQFLVIFLFKNYYLYIIVQLLFQVFINILTAIFSNKMFPKYKALGTLNKDNVKKINQRVKDLFTAKIGGVIVNSVDTIVVSAFLGLTTLAMYQNYYFILTAIINMVKVIFTSCIAGIGNSLITETKEKNFKDLRTFTFIISCINILCTCELLCLYQPFMEWWVGKELLLDFPVVICFCMYYFIYQQNMLICTYKDAAGIWHTDRFRPLVTAIVNLVLDIVLVNIIGIYGVIIATIISIGFIGFPWIVHNLFKELFESGLRKYINELIKYAIIVIFVSFVTYIITNLISGVTLINIIIKGITCFVIVSISLFLIFRKKDVFIETKNIIKKILKIN